MEAMDLNELRKNKRILEQEIGNKIAMFCRNHDLSLNDIEMNVKLIQTPDRNRPEVANVDINLKMEI